MACVALSSPDKYGTSHGAPGQVKIPLPSPPAIPGDYMREPPVGQLPIKVSNNITLSNELLKQAHYILDGRVVGVETVAPRKDGVLAIVNREGQVTQTHCC